MTGRDHRAHGGAPRGVGPRAPSDSPRREAQSIDLIDAQPHEDVPTLQTAADESGARTSATPRQRTCQVADAMASYRSGLPQFEDA